MKKFLALLLCLCTIFSLAACGTEGGETEQKSSGASAAGPADPSASDSSGEGETVDSVPNMVMAHNTITGVFGVYDMDLLEPGDPLEDGLVWSCDAGEGADMKYREDTVFGDVIVTCGDGSAKILSYPEGKILWQTSNPGNNSHAIEILPSGNVAVANSTGGTVRLIYTSALLSGDEEGAKKYKDYELKGGHGVVWDPEYDVLWALGDDELVAYTVNGEGTSQTLMKVGGMGGTLPEKYPGGHDLSADYTDTQYLYMTTNAGALKFNKENNAFLSNFNQSGKLSVGTYMKGLSNNPNGNFFYVQSNFGIGTSWENETFAGWCTDRIHYCYWTSEKHLEVQEYVSPNGAFYKVRAFVGQYQ